MAAQVPVPDHLRPLGWAPPWSQAHILRRRPLPVRRGAGALSVGQPAASLPRTASCLHLQCWAPAGFAEDGRPAGPWELLRALASHRGWARGTRSGSRGSYGKLPLTGRLKATEIPTRSRRVLYCDRANATDRLKSGALGQAGPGRGASASLPSPASELGGPVGVEGIGVRAEPWTLLLLWNTGERLVPPSTEEDSGAQSIAGSPRRSPASARPTRMGPRGLVLAPGPLHGPYW